MNNTCTRKRPLRKTSKPKYKEGNRKKSKTLHLRMTPEDYDQFMADLDTLSYAGPQDWFDTCVETAHREAEYIRWCENAQT
ncbi:hypothetical protein LJC61_02615 [Ruminococcaceae bacterium OttesenSCG-928-A16]|nr:hypothetical protein [Ruminococcaceae bacterium OttesenSCG-928-A16]